MNANADFHSEALLAEAAAWRLASLLLERPRGNWRLDIEALAREVIDPAVASCARSAEEANEELYQRLFGPGGAVSPREVSYCGFEDPGQLMAALQAFYHAFSFQPEREEAIDHIAVEAGFVGYLFLKEAYARMQENGESAEITRRARQSFIQQHLKRCALGALERLDNAPAHIHAALSWLAQKAGQWATEFPSATGKPETADSN
jgi:TorA maturation chaperone TorD